MTKTFSATLVATELVLGELLGGDRAEPVRRRRSGGRRPRWTRQWPPPLPASGARRRASRPAEHLFVVGSGLAPAAAIEAALKLKEMALVHAEGAESWEMASGAATIVGPATVVVALAPGGPGRDATREMARARGRSGGRASSRSARASARDRRGASCRSRRTPPRTIAPLTAVAPGRAARVRPGAPSRPRPGPPRLGRALSQPGAASHRRRRRRRHGGLMMPRIVLVGAGSVEFTRNLLGDILSYPALRDAEIVLHDIDADRLAHRRAHGPLDGRRARRQRRRSTAHLDRREALAGRRLRRQHDPGRGRPGHPGRLRHPGPLRAALHDQRHDQRRRRAPRACARSRSSWASPRHGRRLPRRVVPQLHEPDGRSSSGPSTSATRSADRRAAATPSTGPSTGSPSTWGSPVERGGRPDGRGEPPRLDPAPRARRPRPLPALCARSSSSGRVPDDDLVRADLFRRFGFYPTESSEHHAEYNPWFIPKGRRRRRVDGSTSRSASTCRASRTTSIEYDETEAPARRRRAVRDRAKRRVRRDHRPRHDDRRAGPDRGQRAERRRRGSSPTSTPTPASRSRPSSTGSASTRSRWGRCRPSWPRTSAAPSTCQAAHRPGGARPGPRLRSTTR